MTMEEFLELPEKLGVKLELLEGVLIEMPAANSGHEIVKSNFDEELVACVRPNRIGRVFSEAGFTLSGTDYLIPDVAVLLSARLQESDPAKRFQGAPDLAVEVVSSESAADLEDKIRTYLRCGARLVVVAYPAQRVLHTYDRQGNSRVLEEGQILEIDFLPGFRMPVERAFEDLRPARQT